MPKGFNEQEKEKIRHALMEQGKALFGRYGLRKTGIGELARAAGIAPGSFYAFFHSKEELYFEILEREEEWIKSEFLNTDVDNAEDPKQVLKQLLLQTCTMIEENALFRQLMGEDTFGALLRKLPEEKLRAHFLKDTDAASLLAAKWKRTGVIREIDAEVLAGLFRALFMMNLHKKEIGEQVYPQTLEWLIRFIVDGLVDRREN